MSVENGVWQVWFITSIIPNSVSKADAKLADLKFTQLGVKAVHRMIINERIINLRSPFKKKCYLIWITMQRSVGHFNAVRSSVVSHRRLSIGLFLGIWWQRFRQWVGYSDIPWNIYKVSTIVIVRSAILINTRCHNESNLSIWCMISLQISTIIVQCDRKLMRTVWFK